MFGFNVFKKNSVFCAHLSLITVFCLLLQPVSIGGLDQGKIYRLATLQPKSLFDIYTQKSFTDGRFSSDTENFSSAEADTLLLQMKERFPNTSDVLIKEMYESMTGRKWDAHTDSLQMPVRVKDVCLKISQNILLKTQHPNLAQLFEVLTTEGIMIISYSGEAKYDQNHQILYVSEKVLNDAKLFFKEISLDYFNRHLDEKPKEISIEDYVSGGRELLRNALKDEDIVDIQQMSLTAFFDYLESFVAEEDDTQFISLTETDKKVLSHNWETLHYIEDWEDVDGKRWTVDPKTDQWVKQAVENKGKLVWYTDSTVEELGYGLADYVFDAIEKRTVAQFIQDNPDVVKAVLFWAFALTVFTGFVNSAAAETVSSDTLSDVNNLINASFEEVPEFVQDAIPEMSLPFSDSVVTVDAELKDTNFVDNVTKGDFTLPYYLEAAALLGINGEQFGLAGGLGLDIPFYDYFSSGWNFGLKGSMNLGTLSSIIDQEDTDSSIFALSETGGLFKRFDFGNLSLAPGLWQNYLWYSNGGGYNDDEFSVFDGSVGLIGRYRFTPSLRLMIGVVQEYLWEKEYLSDENSSFVPIDMQSWINLEGRGQLDKKMFGGFNVGLSYRNNPMQDVLSFQVSGFLENPLIGVLDGYLNFDRYAPGIFSDQERYRFEGGFGFTFLDKNNKSRSRLGISGGVTSYSGEARNLEYLTLSYSLTNPFLALSSKGDRVSQPISANNRLHSTVYDASGSLLGHSYSQGLDMNANEGVTSGEMFRSAATDVFEDDRANFNSLSFIAKYENVPIEETYENFDWVSVHFSEIKKAIDSGAMSINVVESIYSMLMNHPAEASNYYTQDIQQSLQIGNVLFDYFMKKCYLGGIDYLSKPAFGDGSKNVVEVMEKIKWDMFYRFPRYFSRKAQKEFNDVVTEKFQKLFERVDSYEDLKHVISENSYSLEEFLDFSDLKALYSNKLINAFETGKINNLDTEDVIVLSENFSPEEISKKVPLKNIANILNEQKSASLNGSIYELFVVRAFDEGVDVLFSVEDIRFLKNHFTSQEIVQKLSVKQLEDILSDEKIVNDEGLSQIFIDGWRRAVQEGLNIIYTEEKVACLVKGVSLDDLSQNLSKEAIKMILDKNLLPEEDGKKLYKFFTVRLFEEGEDILSLYKNKDTRNIMFDTFSYEEILKKLATKETATYVQQYKESGTTEISLSLIQRELEAKVYEAMYASDLDSFKSVDRERMVELDSDIVLSQDGICQKMEDIIASVEMSNMGDAGYDRDTFVSLVSQLEGDIRIQDLCNRLLAQSYDNYEARVILLDIASVLPEDHPAVMQLIRRWDSISGHSDYFSLFYLMRTCESLRHSKDVIRYVKTIKEDVLNLGKPSLIAQLAIILQDDSGFSEVFSFLLSQKDYIGENIYDYDDYVGEALTRLAVGIKDNSNLLSEKETIYKIIMGEVAAEDSQRIEAYQKIDLIASFIEDKAIVEKILFSLSDDLLLDVVSRYSRDLNDELINFCIDRMYSFIQRDNEFNARYVLRQIGRMATLHYDNKKIQSLFEEKIYNSLLAHKPSFVWFAQFIGKDHPLSKRILVDVLKSGDSEMIMALSLLYKGDPVLYALLVPLLGDDFEMLVQLAKQLDNDPFVLSYIAPRLLEEFGDDPLKAIEISPWLDEQVIHDVVLPLVSKSTQALYSLSRKLETNHPIQKEIVSFLSNKKDSKWLGMVGKHLLGTELEDTILDYALTVSDPKEAIAYLHTLAIRKEASWTGDRGLFERLFPVYQKVIDRFFGDELDGFRQISKELALPLFEHDNELMIDLIRGDISAGYQMWGKGVASLEFDTDYYSDAKEVTFFRHLANKYTSSIMNAFLEAVKSNDLKTIETVLHGFETMNVSSDTTFSWGVYVFDALEKEISSDGDLLNDDKLKNLNRLLSSGAVVQSIPKSESYRVWRGRGRDLDIGVFSRSIVNEVAERVRIENDVSEEQVEFLTHILDAVSLYENAKEILVDIGNGKFENIKFDDLLELVEDVLPILSNLSPDEFVIIWGQLARLLSRVTTIRSFIDEAYSTYKMDPLVSLLGGEALLEINKRSTLNSFRLFPLRERIKEMWTDFLKENFSGNSLDSLTVGLRVQNFLNEAIYYPNSSDVLKELMRSSDSIVQKEALFLIPGAMERYEDVFADGELWEMFSNKISQLTYAENILVAKDTMSLLLNHPDKINTLFLNNPKMGHFFNRVIDSYHNLKRGEADLDVAGFWSALYQLIDEYAFSEGEKKSFGGMVFNYFCGYVAAETLLGKLDIQTLEKREQILNYLYHMLGVPKGADSHVAGEVMVNEGKIFIDFGIRGEGGGFLDLEKFYSKIATVEHEFVHALGSAIKILWNEVDQSDLEKILYGYIRDLVLFGSASRDFTKVKLQYLSNTNIDQLDEKVKEGIDLYDSLDDLTLISRYAKMFNARGDNFSKSLMMAAFGVKEKEDVFVSPKIVSSWKDVLKSLEDRKENRWEIYAPGDIWSGYLLAMGIASGDMDHVPEMALELMVKTEYQYHPLKAESIAQGVSAFYASSSDTQQEIVDSIMQAYPFYERPVVEKWAEHYLRMWAKGMLIDQADERVEEILREVVSERLGVEMESITEKEFLNGVKWDVGEASKRFVVELQNKWNSEMTLEKMKEIIPHSFIDIDNDQGSPMEMLEQMILKRLQSNQLPPAYVIDQIEHASNFIPGINPELHIGYEGKANADYTPFIRENLGLDGDGFIKGDGKRNFSCVSYNGKQIKKTNLLLEDNQGIQKEVAGELLLNDSQKEILDRVISELPKRLQAQLIDGKLILIPGQSAHYGLSRAQIYIDYNLLVSRDIDAFRTQLYHELEERAYVVDKVNQYFNNYDWQHNRSANVERIISLVAQKRHVELLIQELEGTLHMNVNQIREIFNWLAPDQQLADLLKTIRRLIKRDGIATKEEFGIILEQAGLVKAIFGEIDQNSLPHWMQKNLLTLQKIFIFESAKERLSASSLDKAYLSYEKMYKAYFKAKQVIKQAA